MSAGNYDDYTVDKLAEILEVSKTTIYSWINQGVLKSTKVDGIYHITGKDNYDFILSQLRKKWERPRQPYIPDEIRGYSEWHQIIDEVCWLFKVCYTPREDVKKKRFRLEIIFSNYLKMHNVSLKKVGRVFASNTNPKIKLITNDLKRGWYNELAYSVPIKKSTLGLSFNDIELNKPVSNIRFAFPSWQIVRAYYSIYFYLRGVTLQKFDAFRLQEHGATITCFKNNVLTPLEKVIWKFPLDISYTPGVRVYRKDLLVSKIDYLKYQYAYHPRTPHSSPLEIFENIYKVFTNRARNYNKIEKYTIFDYLHDFRIWANYLDIDNLLSLWGAGYKSFIDQNLSTLLFFIGGISEICFASVFGMAEYIKALQELYDLFASNNPELESDFVNTPIYQRLLIFNQMGIINQSIRLKRKYNVNEITLS